MGLATNYQKLKKYLKTDSLSYILWQGIRHFILLFKKQKNKFKQLQEKQNDIISKGKIKIGYSNHRINIFWNDIEVTKGVGLSVAINTLGLWTNSTNADWQIFEKGEDYFKVKVVFWDLPLSEVWNIKIEDEQKIDWQIDTEVEEWLHIDEFRIVCLVNYNYKTWICNYQQADFPRLGPNWDDLYLGSQPVSLVGARFPIESKFLPSFVLETEDKNLFPLIQNPPLDQYAHIIGFRHVDCEERKEYSPAYYHLFSGKINLFENDYLLDAKVEDLRQDTLETAIKERLVNKKLKRRMRVLLVNLPWQREGRWGVRAGSRWPHIKADNEGGYLPFPFFLAYATSLLQKHGIDATLIDAIAEQIPEDGFLEKILGMNFDYLITETSIPSFYYDMHILKKISSRGISIILCGPNSEIYKPQFLERHPFISFVLYGEYEFSLLGLLKCLQEGKKLSKVQGLIYNCNGTIKKNSPRQPFDINLLPWPYRESLPMHKYLDAPGEMITPSIQMLASRGCPFKCQFCLWPQVIYQGHHYRIRNVKDVIDEMEYLVKEKGFKSVYFDDDTFNIGKERMLNVCREIRKRGMNKIQWAIMARPDLMEEEILENMKKAGLWAVKYGVESATQNLVDNIGKNMDLKKAKRMIKFTKDLGIRVHLTFTFGLPGETKQTIERTISYVLESDPFSVQFSITTPFPGTEYYEILEKQNSIVSKYFSYYDGNFKSVIKLENLTPEDLEIAKEKAYRIWVDHLRRKRGFLGDLKRFYSYTKDKGVGCALYKSRSYLKYIIFNRKKYLNLSI